MGNLLLNSISIFIELQILKTLVSIMIIVDHICIIYILYHKYHQLLKKKYDK